jgi:hypothetical protein
MLDDFREQAKTSVFQEEEDPNLEPASPVEKQFLGMTPLQRFLIAVMVLLIISILGVFFLLVTGKVMLPL